MKRPKQTSLLFDVVVCVALAVGVTSLFSFYHKRPVQPTPSVETLKDEGPQRYGFLQTPAPISLDQFLRERGTRINVDAFASTDDYKIQGNRIYYSRREYPPYELYTIVPVTPDATIIDFSPSQKSRIGIPDIGAVVDGELLWFRQHY